MAQLESKNNNAPKHYSVWSLVNKTIAQNISLNLYRKSKSKKNFRKIANETLDRLDVRELNQDEFSEYYNEMKTYCEKMVHLEINHKPLVDEAQREGFDPVDANIYWWKSKHISAQMKPKKINYEEVGNRIIEDMKKYSPKYPKLKRQHIDDPHLLVVDPADVHIGKLCDSFETGEEYNSQIAVKRVLEGVQGIISKSRGYQINKILFIAGNDILHIDTPKRTTTSGTPQDTSGMWFTNFLIARQLYVDVLEMLMTVADVHFVYNPSNHDYTHGFFLAQTIETWFRKNKNISFDCSISHRKYYEYGKNLIASTHGDGAKEKDLPLLMAQESAVSWANTKHRYIYTHHIHHKVLKDYIGVTVESLRTPSGTDGWHHRNGYQHNPKAVEGFLHHPTHGQVAKFIHLF